MKSTRDHIVTTITTQEAEQQHGGNGMCDGGTCDGGGGTCDGGMCDGGMCDGGMCDGEMCDGGMCWEPQCKHECGHNCLSINTHYNQGCIDMSLLQFNASLKGE